MRTHSFGVVKNKVFSRLFYSVIHLLFSSVAVQSQDVNLPVNPIGDSVSSFGKKSVLSASVMADKVGPGDTANKVYLNTRREISFKQFAIPLGLMAYGIFAMGNEGLVRLDQQVKDEIWVEDPHSRRRFDNYLQYAIGFSVFGLQAMGIEGKHNFRDQAMLYLLSNAIMGAVVNPMKRITRLQRPDGYGHNAFPSGHTATAFVGAEFLYQEYKDVSPLYGVAGYAMAATVGYMRIYNNKHWMRDVIAGAGIGMASAKLAYIIYPRIQHWLFKDKLSHTAIMPAYENGGVAINLIHRF
jgi:PAP2 superfamily